MNQTNNVLLFDSAHLSLLLARFGVGLQTTKVKSEYADVLALEGTAKGEILGHS